MNTARETRSRLARRIRKDKKIVEKKPSNAALYGMLIFFNAVALLFDLLAATTVYRITGQNGLYGVLAFTAGFVPLVLHEYGYVRAGANSTQKNISGTGVVVTVVTILGTALLVDLLNIDGAVSANMVTIEKTIMWTLRIVAGGHAIAAGYYFYSDDGIQRAQRQEKARAEAQADLEEIKLAGEITKDAVKVIAEEDKIIEDLGGDRDALEAALARVKGDPLFNDLPEEAPIPVTFESAGQTMPTVNPTERGASGA